MGNRWFVIASLGGLLCLTLGPVGAQAQVAAPSIVPSTYASENPAAIKWGAPSRVGLGVTSGRGVVEPVNAKADFVGANAGFRAVGETFAFGLEAFHIADDGESVESVVDTTNASFALQTGSALAWGLGYTSDKMKEESFDQESKESTFGVSLRLGEQWFLGAVIGRETVSAKGSGLFSYDLAAERDTMRYGFGFRRGGTVLVHIEAFGGHRNELKDGAVSFGSEDVTGGVVEFTFGPILIAGGTKRSTYHDATSEFGIDYREIVTGDIGWAPRQGFSLVLHFESRVTKYDEAATSLERLKMELGSVQVAWQF